MAKLSHKAINWIIAGVTLFLIILGIILGVTLNGKKKSTTASSSKYPTTTSRASSSSQAASSSQSSSSSPAPGTTMSTDVWLAWGGLKNNKDVDPAAYVYRADAAKDLSWDTSDFIGVQGSKLSEGWYLETSDAICPGSNDGPQTVPVCAAVPYDVPEDGTKYDCGWYDGSCSGEDRCVASKVATIGLGLLNDPAKKEGSAGIIRDDGSGAIVRLGNYTWTTDSSNVQYRKKKGNCPYGDWHNSDHEHKVMFMPIKGTLK